LLVNTYYEAATVRRKTLYNPHNRLFLAVLVLTLFAVIVWIFIRALGTAFERVGFSPTTIALILAATFFGIYINIPLLQMKTFTPIIREEFASAREYGEATTLIAFNVGGALVPTLISAYLLWQLPPAIPYSMIAVAIVAIVTHVVARPVKGVGITTSALLPP
jgi:uncharacterized membrane protein